MSKIDIYSDFQVNSRLDEFYESIKSGNFSSDYLTGVPVDGIAVFSRKPFDVSLANQLSDFSNVEYDGRRWVGSHLERKKAKSVFLNHSCGCLVKNPGFVYPGNWSLEQKIRDFFRVGDLIIVKELGIGFYDTAVISSTGITKCNFHPNLGDLFPKGSEKISDDLTFMIRK